MFLKNNKIHVTVRNRNPMDLLHITSLVFSLFFIVLLYHIVPNIGIFFKKYGRHHRLCGMVHLFMLIIGLLDILVDLSFSLFWYHILLSCSGLILTLTAAFEFRKVHSKKNNDASGTLEQKTTVTFAEMIEHAFYQFLNLTQIVYLHKSASIPVDYRTHGFVLVCLPWLVRKWFPVNSFSDNYTKGQQNSIYTVMYRIKKYQYIVWKHAVFNGLNLSAAFSTGVSVNTLSFRLFWLILNTAYVMEFFLQSLVKKKLLSQTMMLVLNQCLMLVGSISGIIVLKDLNILLVGVSIFLNFFNRGFDFFNFVFIFCLVSF